MIYNKYPIYLKLYIDHFSISKFIDYAMHRT
jgi:hypothetical protein